MKQSSFLRKGGFVLPAILILAGFFVFDARAYDPRGAHRALTYEMGEFYNLNVTSGDLKSPPTPLFQRGEELTQDDIEALMQGAEEEDTPPKWINHFYNPETGEGWVADKLGAIPQELLAWFSKFALSARSPISAKNWAKNRSAQNDYYLYGGDQTWQRAVELYAAGDKKNGLITLGHTLHLLEDMTVPDHSRNDTHAGLAGDIGSSLETYAKNLVGGNTKGLKIAENLKQSGNKPLSLPNLENYFDANAKYSHDNFFSDDTIEGVRSPFIKYQAINDTDYYAIINKNSDSYFLYVFKDNKYLIKDNKIMSAYWERLSKQAVISGAGAIQLFFKEVEEYKKLNPTPALPSKEGRGQNVGAFSFLKGGVVSPFGELVKLNKKIVQTITGAQNFVTQFLPKGGKSAVVEIDELADNKKPPPNLPLNTEGGKERGTAGDKKEQKTTGVPTSIQNANTLSEVGTLEKEKTLPTDAADTSRDTATDERIYVSHVIDGDTVTLSNGRDVRLIGMDTPESGDECFEEARKRLQELVLGKYVRLEKDQSETDKYGRLLRFIYIESEMINSRMLVDGYAKVMSIPPDTKYYAAFKNFQDEAKFFKRGCLWGGVGGAEDDEIAASPLDGLGTPRNDTEDRGPYYGGSSYASNPERPGQNNTVGSETPYSNVTQETASSTPSLTLPLSTGGGNNDATSTPETATSTPETATSTPETATSTPQTSATSTPETATSTPIQDKILISEIQLAGETPDDEFIELYNPNNKIVSLDGWSIQYHGSSAASFAKKNFSDTAEIPAYGFYLIGHKNYSSSGTADMVHSTFALSATGGTIFLVRGQEKLVAGNEADISDKVAYYNGTPPDDAALFPETVPIEIVALQLTGSMERKSNASSTVESMARGGINETDGNSRDTDYNQNDFIIRETSNPQNTQSPPEDPTNQHYPPEPEPEAEDEEEGGSDESEEEYEEDSDSPSPPEKIVCDYPIYNEHNNNYGEADTTNANVKRLPPIYANITTILPANTTYYIDYWDQAYVKPGARLIIEEGVVLKFGRWRWEANYYRPPVFRVAGSLEINGTKSNPVIFTTFRDDSRGVPINMSTSTPGPEDWGALQIESAANETIKIQNAKFYYGGGRLDGANAYGAAIFINFAQASIDISDIEVAYSRSGIYSRGNSVLRPNITNSNFQYNLSWGAALSSEGIANISGNTFQCNGAPAAQRPSGGVMTSGNAQKIKIENNNFLSNQNYGLIYYPDADANLDAKNNYWGDPSGPYHQSANPTGAGDAVSDNINFTPWNAAS